jgi:malate dehydrogenase
MPVPSRKITVVGAGYVGMTTAHRVLQLELASEVVLIDVLGDRAKGIALDLAQAGAVEGYGARVVGGADPALADGSDVVVMTAGRPRKPGMSRSDLLEVNGRIVVEVAKWIGRGSPDAIVIVVTNPLDSMAALLRRKLAWPARRVIGMAGALDAARFATFIAEALGTSVVDIDAMVLGAHGDSMVPLSAATTVAGVPVKQLLPAGDVAALATRTRNGGAEIVRLLGSGSAFFAPAAGAARMAAAILRDERRLIPCTVELAGEYGIEGLPIGVPCVLGAGGVERILELPLDTEARIGLHKCAGEVQRDIDSLRSLGLL